MQKAARRLAAFFMLNRDGLIVFVIPALAGVAGKARFVQIFP